MFIRNYKGEVENVKKYIRKMTAEPLATILSILLITQLIMLGYCNLVLSRQYLDCDYSMLYVHAIEMWENKTFLIPEWSYITTLELDCPLLLAVPLYGVIGDIYLAYAIANLVFVLLFIWSIFRLFEGQKIKYPLLASVLLLIPYGIGQLDYMNMLFFNGSQYIVKVTLPLMLLAILLHPYKWKKQCKMYHFQQITYILLFVLLTFVTGFSSGVYVAATGLFPIIAGWFLWKLYYRQKIAWDFWFASAAATFSTGLGMLFNVICDIESKGNSMVLCHIFDQLTDNISSCLIGIFELFGGAAYTNVAVMSYAGLNILFRMFFVFGVLICGIVVWKKTVRRESDEMSSILLAVFVWNTFILCICNVRYGSPSFEYRYHIMGMIPMLCITVKVVLDLLQLCSKKERFFGVLAGLGIVLVLNVTSYKNVFAFEETVSELKDVCEYAKELDVDRAYYFNTSKAEICRLLDYKNETIDHLAITWGGNTLAYDYYEKYVEAPADLQNAILVGEDMGEKIELCGITYKRVQVFGENAIYR